MTAALDPELFRQAMRRTAASVAIVTTDGPAGPAGLTVSSLCSLSITPPALIFCVSKASRTLPVLTANGVFAASVLADDQSMIADVFAGLSPEFAERRFAVGTWTSIVTGSPVLAGALCTFDCRVNHAFDINTHRVVIGEVLHVASAEAEPLVFSDRKYWRLAVA